MPDQSVPSMSTKTLLARTRNGISDAIHSRATAMGLGLGICAAALTLASFAMGQEAGKRNLPANPAPSPAGGAPRSEQNPRPESTSKLFPKGLPRLDLFLKNALERHPDVVVAKSKLEAARAELLKAEANALKELISLHQEIQSQRHSLNLPGIDQATASEKLSLLEWEAALASGFQGLDQGAIGMMPRIGSSPPAAPQSETTPNVFVDIAYPKGNHADKIKENPVLNADMIDVTLQDFANLVQEKTSIRVVIDSEKLSENGFEVEKTTFTFNTQDDPFASVLQHLEDRFSSTGLYFVVREYGVLITLRESAPADAVSVLDFIKLPDEESIREKIQLRLETQGQQKGGFGGGFF